MPTRKREHEGRIENFDASDREVYAYLAAHRRPQPKRELIRLVGDSAANDAVSSLCTTGVAITHPHVD